MYSESNPFPLETNFKHRKHQFNQVKRIGKFAIFELEGQNHWEVIVIKVLPPSEFHGMKYDWRENYPTDSQWGIFGWSFMDLDQAKMKMKNLIELEKSPAPKKGGRPKKVQNL